jgi:hypothetical protein
MFIMNGKSERVLVLSHLGFNFMAGRCRRS